MRLFNTLLSLILLLSTTTLMAFPKDARYPGGIAVFMLGSIDQAKPRVLFQEKDVAIVSHQQQWKAIVGLPLGLTKGQHSIDIISGFDGLFQQKSFRVKGKKYRTQRLRIKNKNKVNPNEQSMQRIIREQALKKRLRKTFSTDMPDLNFIRPSKGRDTGRFGLKRILNGEKRNPHSGMDIAAPRGRAVHASSSGRILYIGDLFFSGQVIYIDHGRGVISLYAHLSKTSVNVGDIVDKGQLIGRVGSSGRATGPHLHWSVYLNQTVVNPALFL